MKLGTKEIPALRLGAAAVLKAYLGGSQVWPLGFDPASLFAQGEPGVWYDPSDFSTMFQDAAGKVPVTAVEQPVGLMLDKSKGLVLGPELVTNGTFNNDLTGWTNFGDVTSSANGGVLNISGVNQSGVYQNFTVEAGKTYEFRTTFLSKTASAQVVIYRGAYPNTTLISASGANTGLGEYVVLFTPTISGTYHVRIQMRATGSAQADNISVRELPGNHARQPTTTSRPVLRQDGSGKHYLYFDGVDDFLVTPTITPWIDKVQVFAGVRRLRSVAAEIIAETGNNYTSLGAFFLVTESNNNCYGYSGRGARQGVAGDQVNINFFPPPDTAVLTATQDINGNTPAQMRRNGGVWANSPITTFGGGNFQGYPLYIGRRVGTSSPFNGHLYSLVLRFGSNLPIETIEAGEAWINGKTGAY